MNLLGIYTVGVARSLCRRVQLDIVMTSYLQSWPYSFKYDKVIKVYQ